MSSRSASFMTPTKGSGAGRLTTFAAEAKTPTASSSSSSNNNNYNNTNNNKAFSTPVYTYSFSDDIDALAWLAEIEMEQYAETFLANLSSDGRIILRRRLSTIRQQDLSKMGITSFADQKEIMAHIQLALKFPFNSPVRRKEVQLLSPERARRKAVAKSLAEDLQRAAEKENAKDTNTDAENSSSSKRHAQEKAERKGSTGDIGANNNKKEKKDSLTVKGQIEERRKQARRRRSFDEAVWNKIHHMRNKQGEIAAAANLLREGQVEAKEESSSNNSNNNNNNNNNNNENTHAQHSRGGRRRWSFGMDDESNPSSLSKAHSKAQAYGNLALQYDMIQSNLRVLQHEYLSRFKAAVKCDKASIFFVHENTRDLVLLAEDDRWYRIPAGTSLAGACADTGECVNVPNAYDDHRFNRNVDLKTNYHTRSVLCQPVRRSRGAGTVVAVIEMLNKKNGEPFDAEDEAVIAAASQHVADALAEKFKELEFCAEAFSAIATYVGGKNNSVLAPNQPSYTEHTASSKVKFAPDA